jgi:hypothetical protein
MYVITAGEVWRNVTVWYSWRRFCPEIIFQSFTYPSLAIQTALAAINYIPDASRLGYN